MTFAVFNADPVLLVHAYLDGELDPANALEIERRLAADPALAAERDRVEALRTALRQNFPREAPPPGLRARIEAMVGVGRLRAQPSWRALAASIAATAVIASGSTFLTTGPRPADVLADAVVSGHIRALMSPQSIDVVSSDRHTVKPWFNGRIPEAPRVVDLAAVGFPLVGGRLDVVARTPVPTLVYRHRLHLISLIATPAPDLDLMQAPRAVGGHNLVHWRDAGVSYWAVSDLALTELDEFARLFGTTPLRFA
jgi:anti-sigma factor RsiW